VGGLNHALDFLGRVNSPAYAKIVVAQLEMLALVNQRGKRFSRFVPVRNTLGALATDNTLLFLISIDTVRFWADVQTSIEAAVAAGREQRAARVEIWSTGDIDQRSVALARQYNVAVRQNILENPLFQRPREGVQPTHLPGAPRVAERSVDSPPPAERVNPITGEPARAHASPVPSPDPVRLAPREEALPDEVPAPAPRVDAPRRELKREEERKTEEALPQLGY